MKNILILLFLTLSLQHFNVNAQMREKMKKFYNGGYEKKEEIISPKEKSKEFLQKLYEKGAQEAAKDVVGQEMDAKFRKDQGLDQTPSVSSSLSKAISKGDEIVRIELVEYESKQNNTVYEMKYVLYFKDGNSSSINLKYFQPMVNGQYELMKVETSEE